MIAALLDQRADGRLGQLRLVETDGDHRTDSTGLDMVNARLATQEGFQGGGGAAMEHPRGFKDTLSHDHSPHGVCRGL